MFMGINPADGNLYFTGHFMNSHPPLYLLLFVPQSWTLTLEYMFYLLAPAIVKRSILLLAALILISFGIRLYLNYALGLAHDPWTFRFFPTELMFFLLGILSYKLYVFIRHKTIARWKYVLILVLMLLFTSFYFYLPESQPGYFPFTLAASVYFAAIGLSFPFLFNFLKDNKLDNKIGELSYPVYISHFLVSMVCHQMPIYFLQTGWGVALVTLLFLWVLNKWIAAPVEKYRQARLVYTH